MKRFEIDKEVVMRDIEEVGLLACLKGFVGLLQNESDFVRENLQQVAQAGIYLYQCCPNPNPKVLKNLEAGISKEMVTHARWNIFGQVISDLEYQERKKARSGQTIIAGGKPRVADGMAPIIAEQIAKNKVVVAPVPSSTPDELAYPPALLAKINRLGSLQNQIDIFHKELGRLGEEDNPTVNEKRRNLVGKIKQTGDEMALIQREKDAFDKGEPFLVDAPQNLDLAEINRKIRSLDANISKAKKAIPKMEEALTRMEKLTGEADQKKRANLLEKLKIKRKNLSDWNQERTELKAKRDGEKIVQEAK